MSWLLPLIIACPLFLSLLLISTKGQLSAKLTSAFVGIVMGLCFLFSCAAAALYLGHPQAGGHPQVDLWTWMHVGAFNAHFALALDRLSVVLLLVVSGVGWLILLYACAYMRDDPDIARFFAYMTLFVASMLLLVLASDLLCFYVGWEGVGLCSYLLIGFWYAETPNALAARKAFVVTRIGDAFLIVGIVLFAISCGTLDIAGVIKAAPHLSTYVLTLGTFLLLGGAIAKSAQVPLQTWLPDAMAGPTPVSALIHAATMVTAGVYLIARFHLVFSLAPAVMHLCAIIGFVTLLLAAGAALVQSDIKRILAYSTMSQLGYMYLALGCGAWQGAIFHLVTHAFFKALLFMAAGAIIVRLHHEQNIFRMGGLRRRMPGVFAAFLAGAAALAGLPLITSGFFSKELILQGAYNLSPMFWLGGIIGAFLTALYIFRCVIIVFLGDVQTHDHGRSGLSMGIPMAILSVLALCAGWVEMPPSILPVHLVSDYLTPVFGPEQQEAGSGVLILIGALIPLLGIGMAWLIWRPRSSQRTAAQNLPISIIRADWGFDTLYTTLISRPYAALGAFNRRDVIDSVVRLLTVIVNFFGSAVSHSQSGQVRRYALWMAAGLFVALCLAV